jgi:hypothetical protein
VIGEREDGEGTTRQWKRVTEAALTEGGEDSTGAAAMLPVAVCSGAGGRTRRQVGVCDGA